MAKQIFVFPHDATDFTTTGLVGDLRPIEATFTEEKNGISQITIRMPYDELKKWKACKVGNIIKCEVPIRVPPVVEDGEYANTAKVYP